MATLKTLCFRAATFPDCPSNVTNNKSTRFIFLINFSYFYDYYFIVCFFVFGFCNFEIGIPRFIDVLMVSEIWLTVVLFVYGRCCWCGGCSLLDLCVKYGLLGFIRCLVDFLNCLSEVRKSLRGMYGWMILAFGFLRVNWVSETVEFESTLDWVTLCNLMCSTFKYAVSFLCVLATLKLWWVLKTWLDNLFRAFYLRVQFWLSCLYLFIFTFGCQPQTSSFMSSTILLETNTYFISRFCSCCV